MTTIATHQNSAPAAPSPKKTFQALVDSDQFKSQIANALPKHLTPDRFIRVLMTATIKNPTLLQCTQESMFNGIFDAAAIGLELDGRRAHLVPFKNNKKGCMEATLIVDYKGMAELAYRSGCVQSIHADTVHDNDIFEVDCGELKKHVIDYKKPRGAPYAAYCLIKMAGGGVKCEVMTMEEIYEIRARSKARDSGPWVTDEKEMWKKTVAKRAFKWVPSSPEIRDAIENDGDHEPINVTPKANTAALLEPLNPFSSGADDAQPTGAEGDGQL